jgi:hypothetical protein
MPEWASYGVRKPHAKSYQPVSAKQVFGDTKPRNLYISGSSNIALSLCLA